MLELIELLAGVVFTVGVIAGGWLAVSWILRSSGTGADSMTAILNADPEQTDDLPEPAMRESVLSA